MKKIFLVTICIILLVNLSACVTESPTADPIAEVPLASTSSEPTPANTPLPVTPEPEVVDPLAETPSGYDKNGIPYYSVEEEPEMIYDTSSFGGSYSATIVPFSCTANILNEMAGDASDFDPDTLPVVRRQYYGYFDNIQGRNFYTPTTSAIKNNIKQKLLASNQFTGLNIKENMIKQPEEFMEGFYSLHYKANNILMGAAFQTFWMDIDNCDFYRTIEDAVDGTTFLNEMKDQQYIAGLIEYAGYQNPVCKRTLLYSAYGLSTIHYDIYEETDDPARNYFNMRYNHISVGFSQSHPGKVSLTLIQTPYNSNIMKEYEAISYSEAKQQLLQGNYFTNVSYEVIEEDIKYAELVYVTDFNQKYYVPAYRFYVKTHDLSPEQGFNLWAHYYVPAITGLDFQISDEGFQIGDRKSVV